MPMRKRDLGFVAVVAAILLALLLNSSRVKPKSTPATDRHRPFSEALAKGGKREAVEKGCVSCHGAANGPLPAKHPPKEQCLICHPFQKKILKQLVLPWKRLQLSAVSASALENGKETVRLDDRKIRLPQRRV